MEVEIDIDNQSFDGKNHYRYTAITRNNDQLKVVKMIEDSDWIIPCELKMWQMILEKSL